MGFFSSSIVSQFAHQEISSHKPFLQKKNFDV